MLSHLHVGSVLCPLLPPSRVAAEALLDLKWGGLVFIVGALLSPLLAHLQLDDLGGYQCIHGWVVPLEILWVLAQVLLNHRRGNAVVLELVIKEIGFRHS